MTSFQPPQHGRALLFLDSHASRLDLDAHVALHAVGITVASIPSHTSHILQPLDCGINAKLKDSLQDAARKGKININSGLASYRDSVLYAVIGAHYDACNPLLIRQAFHVTGLVPWNQDIVICDPAKVTPNTDVPVTPEKPTMTQEISGKVITPALIMAIQQRRAEERAAAEAASAEKMEAKKLREIAKVAALDERAKAKADREAKVAAKKEALEEKKRKREEKDQPSSLSASSNIKN